MSKYLFICSNLFFSSIMLFVYGTTIINRKYCVYCGEKPPCIYGGCNANRTKDKFLRFKISNL